MKEKVKIESIDRSKLQDLLLKSFSLSPSISKSMKEMMTDEVLALGIDSDVAIKITDKVLHLKMAIECLEERLLTSIYME